MKKAKFICFLLRCDTEYSRGCGNMNNTTKGGLIGGGGGAALLLLSEVLRTRQRCCYRCCRWCCRWYEVLGVLINRKMDKAAAEAAPIQGAQVEQVTD